MTIVFFDGHCNLCNAVVDFLIRRDHRGVLRFAPLSGPTARARLPRELTEDPGTVVFSDERGLAFASTAAIRALVAIGGGYRACAVLLLVPRRLRDFAYRQIARNRYRWFGRRASCRLPTAAERDRFLD